MREMSAVDAMRFLGQPFGSRIRHLDGRTRPTFQWQCNGCTWSTRGQMTRSLATYSGGGGGALLLVVLLFFFQSRRKSIFSSRWWGVPLDGGPAIAFRQVTNCRRVRVVKVEARRRAREATQARQRALRSSGGGTRDQGQAGQRSTPGDRAVSGGDRNVLRAEYGDRVISCCATCRCAQLQRRPRRTRGGSRRPAKLAGDAGGAGREFPPTTCSAGAHNNSVWTCRPSTPPTATPQPWNASNSTSPTMLRWGDARHPHFLRQRRAASAAQLRRPGHGIRSGAAGLETRRRAPWVSHIRLISLSWCLSPVARSRRGTEVDSSSATS